MVVIIIIANGPIVSLEIHSLVIVLRVPSKEYT